MNSILTTLHAIQKYIEIAIEKHDYKLFKSPPMNKQGIVKPELVHPMVTTGCLPHANFSLYGAEREFFQAPYVLIGYEDGDLQSEEQSLRILINVCCYSQGLYIDDESQSDYNLMIPDNKAFEDCTLFLEWLQQRLLEAGTINGATIEFPVRLGSYNSKELTYPYAFGFLSFDLKANGYISDRKKFKY